MMHVYMSIYVCMYLYLHMHIGISFFIYVICIFVSYVYTRTSRHRLLNRFNDFPASQRAESFSKLMLNYRLRGAGGFRTKETTLISDLKGLWR